MSFLEIFTLLTTSVTIFALIVGLFSVYNGRKTRGEVSRLIRETNESTQRLIRETNENTQRLIKEMWDRSELLLERLAEGQEAAREEHKAILEKLAVG